MSAGDIACSIHACKSAAWLATLRQMKISVVYPVLTRKEEIRLTSLK